MGLAAAECFAEDGANVAVLARRQGPLDEAIASLRALGSPDPLAIPTDLSELTSMLGDLPTGGEIPTDLGDLGSLLSDLPTDSIPTDFGDLTNLNIPGYNSACLSVASAYASISFALLPALLGGSENFNAGDLEKTVNSLSGNVPPELLAHSRDRLDPENLEP